MIKRVLRYWYTLRHLKAEQIVFQVLRRVWRVTPRTGPVPPLRTQSADWTTPIAGAASFDPPGHFTFLNESGDLADIGWNGPERSPLWRYNQHYFADLTSVNASARSDAHGMLIREWIAANPLGQGTGWHAYPTSLRIVAWIKWSLAGNALPPEAMVSLANQARWLSRNLERHILGNHLFVNAKALVFAGLWFEGVEAEKWLSIGLRVLEREFYEQILPDGGHFELSPMYHVLALEDVLDLINIARSFASGLGPQGEAALAEWQDKVADMLHWMATMRHPDGEIGFFNDAAIGIAPSPAVTSEYASRLDLGEMPEMVPGLQLLEASGYARAALGSAVLLADVAQVGPDYLPGHAHADTLSFELSLQGHRMVVNSGTSVYGTGQERLRQRGTAAHATLMVDEKNSSEVWGGFRVARRARVQSLRSIQGHSELCLEAKHDGYTRLDGAPRHHRRWQLSMSDLQIRDRVDGQGHHSIKVLFPLAPGWTPEAQLNGTCHIQGPDGMKVVFSATRGRIEIHPFSYHPKFGSDDPSWQVTVTLTGLLPLEIKTLLTWGLPCAY